MADEFPKSGWKLGKAGYVLAFLGGVGAATGTIYFGQQTAKEPEVYSIKLDGDQIPDLVVKDFIFNNPPGIKWGEKDNFYLGLSEGGYKPLSKVKVEEREKLAEDQLNREKNFKEKMKESAK